MKRTIFMILTTIALALNGCSSNDEPEERVNISLGKSDISILVKEEAVISVSGVDIPSCDVKNTNDFVLSVIKKDNNIVVEGLKVGSGEIIVSCKNSEARCKVTVNGTMNFIGTPYLEFGCSKQEVINNNMGVIEEDKEDYLEIHESPVYIGYHFNNNKLECVHVSVLISNLSKTKMALSLMERYNLLSAETDYYWYSYPDKYVVCMSARGGNGGYNVNFGKTKEIISKYYKVD